MGESKHVRMIVATPQLLITKHQFKIVELDFNSSSDLRKIRHLKQKIA